MDQITLELGGDQVGAPQFAKAVQAFVSVVTAVSRSMCGSGTAVQWTVGIRSGSACIDFVPHAARADVTPLTLTNVTDAVERGVIALEHDQALPPFFPSTAIEKVRDLAASLESRYQPVGSIRIRRNGRAHDITLKTVAHIDAWSGIEYRDWGTVEGTLDVLRGHYGFEFLVYDKLTGRATKCRFTEEYAEDVRNAWMRRVAVSGMIRFRANGDPVSLDVEEFRVTPEEHELPSIGEVRGILQEVG